MFASRWVGLDLYPKQVVLLQFEVNPAKGATIFIFSEYCGFGKDGLGQLLFVKQVSA